MRSFMPLFKWQSQYLVHVLCVLCLVIQSCPTVSCLTFCDPMDCSPPGSSVHGILSWTRILEWVVMPSSRVSSQPRDWTQVSNIVGRFFTIWATREAQEYWNKSSIPLSGDLPDPGIQLRSAAFQANSLPADLPGKGYFVHSRAQISIC